MGLGEPSVPSVSSVTSMFDKKQEPLPGRRISVLKADEKGTVSGPEATGPIVLPPAMANASWSQPGGVASNAPGHLAIGDALHTLWTADAGEGSSKRQRLTAIPIVYGNKIYTMDSEGTVRATSGSDGSKLWSVKTVPDQKSGFDFVHPFNSNNLSRNGFGGGIAADGGKIFAATGFGSVLALDAGSGQVLWSKMFAIPIREAPTASEGRVFVVNSESELLCLNGADGSSLWTQKGLPENAALLTSASPAVAGNLVFAPYPSGEITAVDVKTGQAKWTNSLAKGAINTSATAIGEAARPVVDREAVYAMSRGGQLIATSRDKGVRLWTREIQGTQTPWVAGDTRVRRGRDRQAYRAHPQGWQSALGDGSARGWALERACARGQPPLASFLERAACGGGRGFREHLHAIRSRYARDDYAGHRRGQALRFDRQGQTHSDELIVDAFAAVIAKHHRRRGDPEATARADIAPGLLRGFAPHDDVQALDI